MDSDLDYRYGRSNTARDRAPLAAEFEDCMQSFQSLCSAMETNLPVWESKYLVLMHSRSRLQAWGAELGASNRRLDHALRKNSVLRDEVLEILEDFNQALQTTLDLVQMSQVPLLSPVVQQETTEQSYFDVKTSRDGSIQTIGYSGAELQDILENVDEIQGRLLHLTPSLKNPFPRDEISEIAPSDLQEDIALAQHLFPKAPLPLIERLSRINWRRRQYLKGLRSAGADDDEDYQRQKGVEDLPRRERLLQRVSTMSRGSSASRVRSVDESIFSKRDSYVAGTAPSSADSEEHYTQVRLEVPRPPSVLRPGSTFVCPYCAQEIIVGDTIVTNFDWIKHVYSDLEPYCCTIGSCLRAEKTWGERKDWVSHELEAHRIARVYRCHTCAEELRSKEAFKQHVWKQHDQSIPEQQLLMMASLCERYSQEALKDIQCSFCYQVCSTIEIFREHVADHLEQFALTAVEDAPKQDVHRLTHYQRALERLEHFVIEESQKYMREVDRKNEMPAFYAERGREQQTDPDEPISPATRHPSANTQRPSVGGRRSSYAYMSRARSWKAKEDPVEGNVSRRSTGGFNFDSRVATRTLPPLRNKDFVGRIDEMAKIHKVLDEKGRICVLNGSGGQGKSALAAEYTYRFEQNFSYIFWVEAETPIICTDNYNKIAETCIFGGNVAPSDQRKLLVLSREFLEQTRERWLLVFNNVDEWLDLRNFMPSYLQSTAGSILITTQRTDVAAMCPTWSYSEVNLGPLTLEESRRLLISATNLDSGRHDIRQHPEYKLAGDIAKLAERLPLALSLIAGYVLVSGCSLADFVELWNERRKHATANTGSVKSLSTEADKAMETVWSIGLREVTMDARELLNILAYLDSDNIQKDLLVGEHEDPFLEFLNSAETFRYKRMTTELKRRRLIRIEIRDGEEIISVHRKLQAKILQDLSKNTQQRDRVFSQVFKLLRERFPRPSPIQVPQPEKWPIYKRYIPHVLSLQKLYKNPESGIFPSVELATLFSDGGIDFWNEGLIEEGLSLFRTAESLLDQLGCDEKLLRANIHVLISLLLQDSGLAHIDECKIHSEKAFSIRRIYVETTPDYSREDEVLLYNAWSDYGCIMLQFNRHRDAAEIFEQCLSKYKQWGEPTSIPYEYAKYYHHMAFCHMYRREFSSAISLAEQGLHWVRAATGDGAAMNRWKFDLACIVIQAGDFKRALSLHKEVLESRKDQHGKFAFLTLQSCYAVGAIEAYLGNLEQAEKMMRQVLALEQERNGSCPREALARTQFHLSEVLNAKGDSDEASDLAKKAHEGLGNMSVLEELKNVSNEHTLAYYDHLQPVFDGRFTGRDILRYVTNDEGDLTPTKGPRSQGMIDDLSIS